MPRIRGNQTFIGKIPIGNPKSTIVVSIYDRNSREFIEKLENGNLSPRNLYEIRYDLFDEKSPEDLVFLLKELDQIDVDYIFTYRTTNSEIFSKMYGVALDKLAPAVDMDVTMHRQFRRKPVDGKLMLSYHAENHREIPEALSEMKIFDPDLYKIASFYEGEIEFLQDLISLYQFKEESRKPFSFIPMGSGNSFLRVVSAYAISDFVYARNDSGTAEGQLTYEEYEKIFRYF